jgi:integrase
LTGVIVFVIVLENMKFTKVQDRRGVPVKGLWRRGNNFYAQVNVPNPLGGTKQTKVRLKDCKHVAQAMEAIQDLRKEIKGGDYSTPPEQPTLKDYKDKYFASVHKATKTIQGEDYFLRDWIGFLGEQIKLNEIQPKHILSYRSKQLAGELSPRTINLRVIALRNVLKMAKTEGYINDLPMKDILQLKYHATEKPLLEPEQIESTIEYAIQHCPRSGIQFANYLFLLAYSGLRETECLSLHWKDVDFQRDLLNVPAELNKNHQSRSINFNKKLKNHLLCMHASRKDDGWLFPSRRPNKQGGRITNFRKTLEWVRGKTGIYLTDHLLRHYFVSKCVMEGLDFMTIARWVGHTDGGILIGKVYGHLNNEHLVAQAAKLKNI